MKTTTRQHQTTIASWVATSAWWR